MTEEVLDKGQWKGWTRLDEGGVYQKQFGKHMVKCCYGFFYLYDEDGKCQGSFGLLKDALEWTKNFQPRTTARPERE